MKERPILTNEVKPIRHGTIAVSTTVCTIRVVGNCDITCTCWNIVHENVYGIEIFAPGQATALACTRA